MAKKTIKSKITDDQVQEAMYQLIEHQKQIDYDTKDFTIELLVSKFKKGDFFIPDYQRNYVWKEKNKSKFIESVLLGLPIPFMFFGNCPDGRLEVIDGAQRLQTLSAFYFNELKLSKLEKLDKLNGFFYSDLAPAQQKRFENNAMRIIVLEERTPNDIRQDLFNRINTSGLKANDAEVRRGSYPGMLTDFIEKCATNEKFIKLCPVSEKSVQRYERFELILRFFAYVNEYLEFIHDVGPFLDNFLVRNLNSFDEVQYYHEFINMLNFVEENFPNGFAKTKGSRSTPRVRFEAISVGVALALRIKPNLKINDVNWINSFEFKEYTTSDASNNQGKLRARIEFVRDQLLRSDVNA